MADGIPLPDPSVNNLSWPLSLVGECYDNESGGDDDVRLNLHPGQWTDGLESFVQSVMVSFLRQVVDNLDNWEGMLEEFNFESVLWNNPSYSDLLNQIINNVHSDLTRLLQERNPSLREEEDNHVSSRNNEGRPGEDGGCNDVRFNGGIEEPAGETPRQSTVIAHGTDGLERCLQYVIVQRVRRNNVNLDNIDNVLMKLELEFDSMMIEPLTTHVKQIIRNVRIELLRMREINPEMSLEDLKVYCVPLCWSSKNRVDFWSDLSDELLSRANELKELKELRLELDRTCQLHFGEKWNDKIDDELLSSVDELKKLMLKLKKLMLKLERQLHFGEKQNRKVDDELLSRVDELKKLMLELRQLHFGEKRNDKIDKLLSRAIELLVRADKLKKLRLELERTWQLHFGEKRNEKIDEEWIKKFGDEWGSHFGDKWIDIIDEEWIENFGKKWINEKIKIEENDKTIENWIENVDFNYKPRGSDFIFVRGLLRFMRNRRHHLDKFQKLHGLRSVESFYNYLDALFPCLLMVSYGVAYRFCREEPWFEKYLVREVPGSRSTVEGKPL